MIKFIFRYPVAIFLTILLLALFIFCYIFKIRIQLGGIFNRIWNKTSPHDPDIRAQPPEDRVDDDGVVIPVETSDEDGWVQKKEMEIIEPHIFSDPSIISVVHPEKGPVNIKLPKGIKNEDVKQVILIAPDLVEVRNKDKVKKRKVVDKLMGD